MSFLNYFLPAGIVEDESNDLKNKLKTERQEMDNPNSKKRSRTENDATKKSVTEISPDKTDVKASAETEEDLGEVIVLKKKLATVTPNKRGKISPKSTVKDCVYSCGKCGDKLDVPPKACYKCVEMCQRCSGNGGVWGDNENWVCDECLPNCRLCLKKLVTRDEKCCPRWYYGRTDAGETEEDTDDASSKSTDDTSSKSTDDEVPTSCYRCEKDKSEDSSGNGGVWGSNKKWVCDECLPNCRLCLKKLVTRDEKCCPHWDYGRTDDTDDTDDNSSKSTVKDCVYTCDECGDDLDEAPTSCYRCEKDKCEGCSGNGGDWGENENWVCDRCLPKCRKCLQRLERRDDECCDFGRTDDPIRNPELERLETSILSGFKGVIESNKLEKFVSLPELMVQGFNECMSTDEPESDQILETHTYTGATDREIMIARKLFIAGGIEASILSDPILQKVVRYLQTTDEREEKKLNRSVVQDINLACGELGLVGGVKSLRRALELMHFLEKRKEHRSRGKEVTEILHEAVEELIKQETNMIDTSSWSTDIVEKFALPETLADDMVNKDNYFKQFYIDLLQKKGFFKSLSQDQKMERIDRIFYATMKMNDTHERCYPECDVVKSMPLEDMNTILFSMLKKGEPVQQFYFNLDEQSLGVKSPQFRDWTKSDKDAQEEIARRDKVAAEQATEQADKLVVALQEEDEERDAKRRKLENSKKDPATLKAEKLANTADSKKCEPTCGKFQPCQKPKDNSRNYDDSVYKKALAVYYKTHPECKAKDKAKEKEEKKAATAAALQLKNKKRKRG